MKSKTIKTLAAALALSGGVALFSAGGALASTCLGSCGIQVGLDGDVTAPIGAHQWISTNGGTAGTGTIGVPVAPGGAGSGVATNGSKFTSTAFAAGAGDSLSFYFNYITSDGAGFADYAWAELVDSASAHVAWLFTARTVVAGDTSPGFGLPANAATLLPPTSAIAAGTGVNPNLPGGPVWSPLGGSSGYCYAAGCGLTGWINSTYTIASAGTYSLVFGVTNWGDEIWDSGLAWYGAQISGPGGVTPIDPVPLPAALPLLAGALGGLGLVGRWRKRRQAKAAMA